MLNLSVTCPIRRNEDTVDINSSMSSMIQNTSSYYVNNGTRYSRYIPDFRSINAFQTLMR